MWRSVYAKCFLCTNAVSQYTHQLGHGHARDPCSLLKVVCCWLYDSLLIIVSHLRGFMLAMRIVQVHSKWQVSSPTLKCQRKPQLQFAPGNPNTHQKKSNTLPWIPTHAGVRQVSERLPLTPMRLTRSQTLTNNSNNNNSVQDAAPKLKAIQEE